MCDTIILLRVGDGSSSSVDSRLRLSTAIMWAQGIVSKRPS